MNNAHGTAVDITIICDEQHNIIYAMAYEGDKEYRNVYNYSCNLFYTIV